MQVHYPAMHIRPLPTGRPQEFPKIQASFPSETTEARKTREDRQEKVKEVFTKAWKSYKNLAWLSDELKPVSGDRQNPFGGWAATLVDSLDTLWIMGMQEEFHDAVAAAVTIDFTKSTLQHVNVFETNIRYLGGFLAAYDLSGDARLLRKAIQVGEMLYKAFDTPNRMPITRWDVHAAAKGEKQIAPDGVLVAEIGSLTMEFTRLSLLTRDPKWFDAVQRISDIFQQQQDSTSLPGLWPLVVNARDQIFNQGTDFTVGAMADSLYEYLPKMSALLGGKLPEYQSIYEKSMETAVKYNLFRPMTPTNADILISGQAHVEKDGDGKPWVQLQPEGQHLVCFIGGLFALAGKMYNKKDHVDIATKLVDGCIWTYKASQHGIMPETFTMAPCKQKDEICEWDETLWKKEVLRSAGESVTGGDLDEMLKKADEIIAANRLPKGFTSIPDRRYILRPEAIESVFVLYRATGRADLPESAWDMFTSINKATETTYANSAVSDITVKGGPSHVDSMESFWMGETLKYFYLMFSEPSLVSLDEFVFNTEAHPFRRVV